MTERQVDFLVIGSGIAGLWFAHRVGGAGSVLIVTKKSDTESNTNYAQGGIAAAVAGDDSPALHMEDTLRVGSGIAHADIVRLVTEAGPRLVRELAELGVAFSTRPGSSGSSVFDLGQEGGHRRRRIVHARDLTGAEIERGLVRAVRAHPEVGVLQDHIVVDLALDRDGRCCGAYVIDTTTGVLHLVRASVCLLATGGVGQVYLHTTNPRIATGDGVAIGYRAGALIADMEFIQFHPTSLFGHLLEGRAFLISEAVRGEGAVLTTKSGRRFMEDYHPDAELAPRDVVARAIASELGRLGDDHVLLDATRLGAARLRERFPTIYETCLGFGIDITREPIPVVPAAHYVCGGVQSDEWAQSTIPGLFAAGECACSGLHGANRLASNSLLEALVFADRAAERAMQPGAATAGAPAERPAEHSTGSGRSDAAALTRRLQALMWHSAGIVRSDSGLQSARQELLFLAEHWSPTAGDAAAVEAGNLLTVAQLIIECAICRRESRGLHYNQDHPATDEAFAHDTVISRAGLEPGC